MSGSCQGLAKFSIVLNVLIYFVGGSCLILLGSLIIDNAGSAQNFIHSAYILLPSIIMLIAGLFMVAFAFVGCFACLKQTKCLNYTFFVVMFVIILVECAALGLSIRYRSELQGFVEKEMRVGLEKYDNEPSVRSEFDAFQERGHCCGILNYTDWYDTSYFKNKHEFPSSCCVDKNCTMEADNEVPSNIFEKGCLSEVESFFNRYFVYLIVGYTVFILIQGSALIATCVIIRRSNLDDPHRYAVFSPEA